MLKLAVRLYKQATALLLATPLAYYAESGESVTCLV